MGVKDMGSIQFHYLVPAFHFSGRKTLKQFLLRLFKMEGISIEEVNYIFCSDEYLLQINQAHLNHDTYTDIITFQYTSPPASVSSDIYISIERVKENSQIFSVSFRRELSRVILHGALHLCGYKDKSRAEIATMRAKEEHYLSKLFHVK
jgi:probable rRNA maturation factor